MRPEDLFRAMNEIDNEIIEKSENYKGESNIAKIKHYVPLAACACFAIIILAVVPNAINKKQVKSEAVMLTESAGAEVDSVVEEGDIEESVMEESAIEESAIEESVMEESVMEESAIEESAIEDSLMEESVVEEGTPEESAMVESDSSDEAVYSEEKNGDIIIDEVDLKMYLNDVELDVAWEENESVKALMDAAKDGPITIQMSRYGDFEQIGEIGQKIISDDIQYSSKSGDIVLYNSSNIVIFYGENTWNYTKLGSITNISQEELHEMLSKHDASLLICVE